MDRNCFTVILAVRAGGVALLAEGVDRNFALVNVAVKQLVALLAEGVDRNIVVLGSGAFGLRRPPRGGRG